MRLRDNACRRELTCLTSRTGNGDELEEQYHSWQWSPIFSEPFVDKPFPGTKPEVLGLFNTTKNTTSEVLAERRGKVLRDLRDLLGKAREADEFNRAVVEGLASEPKDLPFMMWYHVQLEENNSSTKGSKTASEDERSMASSRTPTIVRLRLGGSVGAIDPEQDFSIEFSKEGKAYNLMPDTPGEEDDDEDLPSLRRWPFREALACRQKMIVEDCRPFVKGWTPRSWGVLPSKAVVIPICVESDEAVPYGVLVIGLNPRCPFDEDYQAFAHSVSLQIYAGIIQMKADQIQRLEERADEAEHRRSIAEEERRQQELLVSPKGAQDIVSRGPCTVADKLGRADRCDQSRDQEPLECHDQLCTNGEGQSICPPERLCQRDLCRFHLPANRGAGLADRRRL